MRKAALLLIFVFISSVLFAGEIRYEIGNYRADKDVLNEKITAKAEDGFTPLGLTHDADGRVSVLYVSGIIEFDSWQLVEYQNMFAFQDGMTERLEAGMYPVGLSLIDGKYHVLFIRSKNTVTSWQLVRTGFSERDALKDLKPYFAAGFLPAAISGSEDKMAVLLLEMEEQLGKSWNLIRYPAEGDFISRQIAKNLQAGRIPWGIHFKDNKLYISYIQL